MNSKSFYINKYFPFAVLYLFLNSIFLPIGLLYTSILTPFFIFWLYSNNFLYPFWFFFGYTLFFSLFHIINGVDLISYFKSFFLLFATFTFSISFLLYLKKSNSIRLMFRDLIILNFLITIIAIIFYFIPNYSYVFWDNNVITNGTSNIKRLKMLTYEASYYSTLIAPLAIYYYLKMILFELKSKWTIFLIISIPLVLSFSLGVILSLILTFTILFLSDIKLFFIKKGIYKFIILSILAFVIIFVLLLKLFPDNILFIRFINIFKGNDTSFKGRTTDSFYLAWQIASQKSILFGCGPGQIKILGSQILSAYYKANFTPENTVIPNSLAETLAVYGLFGFLLKLFLEVNLFFRTKVYTNYYRLALFIFIFIYQFTGSFITNIAEYVIWIMAFYPLLFPEFNKINLFSKDKDSKANYTPSLS